MKLRSILFSQIAWAVKVVPPAGGLHFVDTVQAVRDRYGFVEFPRNLENFDLGRGVVFRHGKFTKVDSKTGNFVIGELRVYDNGLLVNATAATDDLERFLDDLSQWVEESLGIGLQKDEGSTKVYTSHLEAELSAFPSPDPIVGVLAGMIGGHLSAYENKFNIFQPVSFSLGFDAFGFLGVFPVQFQIARRKGFPFSSNVFFCEAPVKTPDHIALLEEYERQLAKSR